MAKASVTLDEISETNIVISTPELAKTSDRALANGVVSTVECAAENGVAKLGPCRCMCLAMDIEEEARTGDGRSCLVDKVGVVLIGRNCVCYIESCFIDLSVGIEFPPT